jgi:hypothetical protein
MNAHSSPNYSYKEDINFIEQTLTKYSSKQGGFHMLLAVFCVNRASPLAFYLIWLKKAFTVVCVRVNKNPPFIAKETVRGSICERRDYHE